jgi:hypothetical protein
VATSARGKGAAVRLCGAPPKCDPGGAGGHTERQPTEPEPATASRRERHRGNRAPHPAIASPYPALHGGVRERPRTGSQARPHRHNHRCSGLGKTSGKLGDSQEKRQRRGPRAPSVAGPLRREAGASPRRLALAIDGPGGTGAASGDAAGRLSTGTLPGCPTISSTPGRRFSSGHHLGSGHLDEGRSLRCPVRQPRMGP